MSKRLQSLVYSKEIMRQKEHLRKLDYKIGKIIKTN